jgi:hypothetical protein
MYKTIYTEVEVDVNLSDFETDDLIEELESRGELPGFNADTDEMLNQIYQLRRLGKDYDKLLDQYLYQKLGRVI